MYINIIKKYIDGISKEDIKTFANKDGINITNNEVDVIYYYIKNKSDDIINLNCDYIFDDLKTKLSKDTYQKIMELFDKYKFYLM